jgi:hypothetical protein
LGGNRVNTSHQKEEGRLGVVVISVIPATWEVEVGGSWAEGWPQAKNMRSYLKNKVERDGGVA